jgi:TRAP-type C4-dicarboxylate transport system permease small subunit
MFKFSARISALCNLWVERSLAAMGITMAAIVVAQVFCRYVLNASLFWSEELARYLLVWLTFLGASSAYYRRVHPGIDIVTLRLKGSLKKLCRIAVHLASAGFFVVMIYHGCAFAYFIRTQISPALALPKWIVFSVIPLSGVLFLLHCLAFLIADVKEENHDH